VEKDDHDGLIYMTYYKDQFYVLLNEGKKVEDYELFNIVLNKNELLKLKAFLEEIKEDE
jgi:hypothetical protein